MLGLPNWVIQVMVVITMCNTITAMELVKRKHYYGWYVSIANQVLWLILNIQMGLWGFLVLNVYITFNSLHAIALWKSHDALVKRAKEGDDAAMAEVVMRERPGMIPVHFRRVKKHEQRDD